MLTALMFASVWVTGVVVGFGAARLCQASASGDDADEWAWEREADLHESTVQRIEKLTADERESLLASAAENRLYFVPPGE